jgi:hypothetical protein
MLSEARLDLAVVKRGAVNGREDDLVRARVGVRHVAGDLVLRDALGGEAERARLRVAGLDDEAVVAHCSAVNARRRIGLEAPEFEPRPSQAVREALGRRLADPAARLHGRAAVQHAAQERAGCQDDRLCPAESPVLGPHALHAPAFDDERRGHPLAQGQVLPGFEAALHLAVVGVLVRLCARRVHGRPLARVDHAELHARGVDDLAHLTAQGVYLAHELPFGEAADGGIAAHAGDAVQAHGQQGGAGAHAGSSQRRLAPGMAGAHHDDVEIRVSHGIGLKAGALGQVRAFYGADGTCAKALSGIAGQAGRSSSTHCSPSIMGV